MADPSVYLLINHVAVGPGSAPHRLQIGDLWREDLRVQADAIRHPPPLVEAGQRQCLSGFSENSEIYCRGRGYGRRLLLGLVQLQHLRVLRQARLVSDRRDGTRRYYRASREGLAALRRYVESLWDDVLAAYAADDPHPPMRRPESIPGSGPSHRLRGLLQVPGAVKPNSREAPVQVMCQPGA